MAGKSVSGVCRFRLGGDGGATRWTARVRLLLFALAVISAVGLMVAGLAGCGTAAENTVADSGFLVSDVIRQAPPASAQDSTGSLVAGNNAFSLELFRELRSANENLVCSPYSLSAVLAMTWAGAAGGSEEEMARVLHFDLPQAQLHDAFNALDQWLSATGEFKVANALWGSDEFAFNQGFVDLLARDYGAGLAVLDFDKTEEARTAINGWVDGETNGRIPELVGPDDIKNGPEDDPIVLMLTDAVYFKADWAQQFPKEVTRDLPFYLNDGGTVQVPTMSQEEDFPNGKSGDFQAVELPYEGDRFSMVLVLPETGTFEDFASAFDDAKLAEVLASLEESQVYVLMPRFEFSSTPDAEDALKGLGMAKMFEPGGDFFGMLDESKALPDWMCVSGVKQKAFISVGEQGTEAVAASAVTMVAGAAMMERNEILLNRPFLYLIRDVESGQIVFVGQVVDPSKAE